LKDRINGHNFEGPLFLQVSAGLEDSSHIYDFCHIVLIYSISWRCINVFFNIFCKIHWKFRKWSAENFNWNIWLWF